MKVLIVALIATTIITWPFLPNLGSFYTDQGDYATHGSILWWNADSIATGRIFNQAEYFKGYQFYPHPYSLAFANNHVFPAIVFSPLYWISGSLPFSFNTYLFLTFVASFLAMFYTVRYFLSRTVIPARHHEVRSTLGVKVGIQNTGSRISRAFLSFGNVKYGMTIVDLASLVGAFIFAFNPQTMTRFPQHVELLGKYFLPLIFLFGFKFLDKPTLKNAFWLFLFITLNSLTANYFQVFVAVMLPLVAIPFLIKAVRGKDWNYFGKLAKSGLIALVFLPILLYFNMPFWEYHQKEGAFRSIEESIFFSGRINDWLAPPQNNLIYGSWSTYLHQFREPKDNRGILNYEEHTLFIGVLATVLFFVGFKAFSGSPIRSGMTGAGKRYFLILLLVPFVLIFGPFFPPREDGMKLPFYFLYEWIPVMKGIRAPVRFEYLFFIPFALIASFGALRVLERVGRRGIWAVGVIGLILILENFTIKDFSSRSKVLQKLDSGTVQELAFLKGKTTLHLPIYTIDDADIFGKNSYVSTWVTKTGERVVNGNSGYFPQDSLKLLFGIREDVNEAVLKRLSILGVNYIVFHIDMLAPEEQVGLVKNSALYEKGIVYNKKELIILDISKYQFNLNLCSFPDDFDIRVTKVEDENFNQSNALIIDNKKDCFLANIYQDRFREWDKFQFRLPMLIVPNEQIVVSEYNRELRVK